MSNYIIGAGTAGLIAGFYNTKHIIIDKNPLGQLGLRFIPGVRVFKDDEYVRSFLGNLYPCWHLKTKRIKVGYEYDKMGISEYATDAFKTAYSMITRGTPNYKPSFLSSGQNEFDAITVNDVDPNDFYVLAFRRLNAILHSSGQIIYQNIKKIDVEDKKIYLDNGTWFNCDELISTIRMDILEKLMSTFNDIYTHDYSLGKKCFYKCEYSNPLDILHKDIYSYVYSVASVYTRKTYFKDYIVYETTMPLNTNTPLNTFPHTIDGNLVVDKYENVPLQLKRNYCLNSFQGIKLLGRFAQWDHSIKSNEVIKTCKEWIS